MQKSKIQSTATPPKANYRNPPALDGVCLRMALLRCHVQPGRRLKRTLKHMFSLKYVTYAEEKQARCEWFCFDVVTVTVTVTINGLVKLSAFNAHICPSKYLASF